MSDTDDLKIVRRLLAEVVLHLGNVDQLLGWYQDLWESARTTPRYLREHQGEITCQPLSYPLLLLLDNVSEAIAQQRGWQSDTFEDEPVASLTDLVRALREPVPIATVLAAVYGALGVALPEELSAAVADCEPLPC